MSFPVNGVLDSFSRADNASTLGSNWTISTNEYWGSDALGIISDTAYDPAVMFGSTALWNVSSFSSVPVEVYVTFSTVSSSHGNGVVYTTDLTPHNGYYLVTKPSGFITLNRVDGFSTTNLTSILQTVSNGDSIGFSLDTSGHFIIYYKAGAGSWTQVGTYTDTTYSCSYIGIFIADVTARLSNFGGGVGASSITVSAPKNSITSSTQPVIAPDSISVAVSKLSITSSTQSPQLPNVSVNISSALSISSSTHVTSPSVNATLTTSTLNINSQSRFINAYIDYPTAYAVKILSYNPLLFVSGINPVYLTRVYTTGPDSPTWQTVPLIGVTGVASVAVDTNNGWIYASCNAGLVAKININNLNSYSITNLSDANSLETMDVNSANYLAYTSTSSSTATAYIIDLRITQYINTNFYVIAGYGLSINTSFSTLLGQHINTNFVCSGSITQYVNTNFVVLSENYNEIAPLGRTSWAIYIDGVQLDNTDLDLASITITHGAMSLFQKSRATFTLTRQHDAVNTTWSGHTVTITNQNTVQIYIGSHLEFTGQVAQLNCTYQQHKEMVEVLAYMPQPNPQYNLITLPLPSLTEKLHLYHVLMESPKIYNPYINPDDQAPEKYLGVQMSLGDWTVEHITQFGGGPNAMALPIQFSGSLNAQTYATLAEQITNGVWFPTQNYTYFWFVDASTISISNDNFTSIDIGNNSPLPDPLGLGQPLSNVYVGTSLGGLSSQPYQLNSITFSAQRDLPNEYYHLGTGTVTELDLETLYPGYGTILYNALNQYKYLNGNTITQAFNTSIYPAPSTVSYVGTIVGSLAGFGLSAGGYNQFFYIGLGTDLTQRAYNALLNALGYFVGSPPYKKVSARKGIYEAALRYTDGPDGFYQSINAGYNFQAYDQQIAELEYQKLLNINGQILPITSVSFELTLDAYYYYGIYLLTRINISNTTTPNIYNNNNGFPVEVKTIVLSSADMRVKLETSNEKSAIELQAIDAEMPLTDDYIYPGQSILINRKYDLQNQITVT